eukprot:GFYU01009524.1.p1 GENE.GFYU01009524.1~~GFYU01009524.1.p1  ORF type:complete len:315 (+),score=34.70 GFYU01009524.1:58-1002(+)
MTDADTDTLLAKVEATIHGTGQTSQHTQARATSPLTLSHVKRLRRQLLVRTQKKRLGLKPFDLDHYVSSYNKSTTYGKCDLISDTFAGHAANNSDPLAHQGINGVEADQSQDSALNTLHHQAQLDRLQSHGSGVDDVVFLGVDDNAAFKSPYTKRMLKPCIHRDTESLSKKEGSIHYKYLRPWHLSHVNELLSEAFWPGIDVRQCLEAPDYTVIAMSGDRVVGCALATPEGYLTYICVVPEFRRIGIAKFMLYQVIQSIPNRDITLHVSPTNNAMLLYQKFGFKNEEYILNFYRKYLPPDTDQCVHAYFLRMRR